MKSGAFSWNVSLYWRPLPFSVALPKSITTIWRLIFEGTACWVNASHSTTLSAFRSLWIMFTSSCNYRIASANSLQWWRSNHKPDVATNITMLMSTDKCLLSLTRIHVNHYSRLARTWPHRWWHEFTSIAYNRLTLSSSRRVRKRMQMSSSQASKGSKWHEELLKRCIEWSASERICWFLVVKNELIKYSWTYCSQQIEHGHCFHPRSCLPFITKP